MKSFPHRYVNLCLQPANSVTLLFGQMYFLDVDDGSEDDEGDNENNGENEDAASEKK
jgi:hypothetical protein